MMDILSRHGIVRALFDNRWLHLFALDEDGRMAWRYAGDLEWTAMNHVDADEPWMQTKVTASLLVQDTPLIPSL